MDILPDNKSFEGFIKILKLGKKEKEELISKLPKLDDQEKVNLLEYLMKIWLIDKAEEKSLQRLRKHWVD